MPLSEQAQRATQIHPVLPQHDVADAVAAQPVQLPRGGATEHSTSTSRQNGCSRSQAYRVSLPWPSTITSSGRGSPAAAGPVTAMPGSGSGSSSDRSLPSPAAAASMVPLPVRIA